MAVTTTDPKWVKPESYSAYERFWLRFMRDERDMIFIRTATLMSVTVLPAAVLLFTLSPQWVAWLAAPYLGFTFAYFGGRYGLMLHATGHRPCFRGNTGG